MDYQPFYFGVSPFLQGHSNTNAMMQQMQQPLALEKECLILPENFQPSETEVIIGRGKKCAVHAGNRKFREFVRAELDEYSEATTKAHKSSIIVRVLTKLRERSPHPFVKQDLSTKRWCIVEENAQRITTVSCESV